MIAFFQEAVFQGGSALSWFGRRLSARCTSRGARCTACARRPDLVLVRPAVDFETVLVTFTHDVGFLGHNRLDDDSRFVIYPLLCLWRLCARAAPSRPLRAPHLRRRGRTISPVEVIELRGRFPAGGSF